MIIKVALICSHLLLIPILSILADPTSNAVDVTVGSCATQRPAPHWRDWPRQVGVVGEETHFPRDKAGMLHLR